MAIYKGTELVSGRGGKVGLPGMNSSGGTDMGSIILPIAPSSWLFNGTDYVRVITPAEHHMAASPALLAFTAEYNEDFTLLERIDGFQAAALDGTITLKSGYPWQGVCIVAGGISQAMDAIARQSIQSETDRATEAESGLQALIQAEETRAKAAEGQALTDAKDYTDEKIADTVAAAQTWLPAVRNFADLPTVTDTTKTYLCRVISTNNVYQRVAGQTAWDLYSENTDYIDEEELAEAIQVETSRATLAESGLQTAISNEVTRATTAEAQALANAKAYTDTKLTEKIPPLYGATGQMTDGAMTQKATTDAINAIAAGAFVPYIATVAWSGSVNNYSYNLPASVHGKGVTPTVTTLQSGIVIECAPYIDSAGNITIYSNANLSNIKMEVR